MIDLKNSYIKNDNGQLLDSWLNEANKQLLNDFNRGSCFFENYCFINNLCMVDSLICIDQLNGMEELTLADFNTRTKTEYVKYDGKFSGLASLFEDGEVLYTADDGRHNPQHMDELLSLHEYTGVFRKVETEIKTEKRWVVYNRKGMYCSEHDYKFAPFDKTLSVIEIEIEVEK